jgi:hypothetical protein
LVVAVMPLGGLLMYCETVMPARLACAVKAPGCLIEP